MISASLSLSLPSAGWKSTSMPRSLKICTAAGDRASEISTFGLVIGFVLHPPLEGEGRCAAPGWGEAINVKFRVKRLGEDHPTPPHLRCIDPPPPGEGEKLRRFRERGLGLGEGPINPLRQQCNVARLHRGTAPDAQTRWRVA